MHHGIQSITLLGSSSGRNAGDAALVAAIMDSVDRALGRRIRYEIPTPRAAYIRDHYPNDARPVGMMPWQLSVKMLGLPTLRSILRTDLTLIFDAILFDRSLFNPLFNFLSTLYLLLPLARRFGKRMACYDVGVGPIHTRAGRHMLRRVLGCMDFVTVRDEAGLALLRENGIEHPRARLAADAALNAPAADAAAVDAIFRRAGLAPGEPALGININRYLDTWAAPGRRSMGAEAFLNVFAGALTRVWNELKTPLVFVTTQHHDVEITRDLMDRLPPGVKTALIANRDYDHAETKGALGRLDLLCGMRLHSLILATAGLTPAVGIAYQPKVKYYFDTLGLGDRVLSFDDFTEEKLAGHILRGWNDRAKIRAALEQRIPPLGRLAARPADLVAAMDRGEDLDRVLQNTWPTGTT
ncbi:MAG: polysaccharide pyruvyl transferase family protein [Kiritimatiellae bacterium]|nr:polysaccharide pyruvyl transferase family protein [Kiritimatiellia bacterium]